MSTLPRQPNEAPTGQPQPPSSTIFAPDKVGSTDGIATINVSGTAQDASGVDRVK